MRFSPVIKALCFCGYFAFFATLPALSMAAPNAHEIIQKLASESFVPASFDDISFQIPKGWKSKSPQKNIFSFWVPYHPGIAGGFERLETPGHFDEIIKNLAQKYNTTLDKAPSDIETQTHSGQLMAVSGRFGGEICQVLIFTGKHKSGHDFYFYAITPTTWFKTYQTFFEDIIWSMTQG